MTEEWTPSEIARSYRLAKNKYDQIKILAELTLSDDETIIQILEEQGCFQDKKVCAICGKEYQTWTVSGKGFCPDCKKKQRRIWYLKDKVKRNTAKIQQLGLESAKIRAEIEKLEKEVKK